jgi:hypothetical protein
VAGDRRRAAGGCGGSRVHRRRCLVWGVDDVVSGGNWDWGGERQVRTEREEACEMFQAPGSATRFSTENCRRNGIFYLYQLLSFNIQNRTAGTHLINQQSRSTTSFISILINLYIS